MKKFIVSACALAIACTASAQKFSFKKGKMSIDDVPVAKYDGKGGFFKMVSIDFTTLDDQPLIHVEEKNYDFKNPLYPEAKIWLDIKFSNGTTVLYPMKMRMTEKVMLNDLFKDGKPGLIRDGKLDEEAVKNFAATYKYDFVADSAAVAKMEEENITRLSKIMPRDVSKPIILQSVPQSNQLLKVFDVYQAEMLIGRIEKRLEPFGTDYRYDYSAWIKSEPYTFNGQQYQFSPIAYFKNASPVFENDVVFMKDKKAKPVKFKTPAPASAEQAFAQFLISTGNL